MSFMVKYGCPSCSPTSYTGTMFGWSSCAAAPASVLNRAFSSAVASSSERIIFTATVRPRRGSNASYTAPIPPTAISRRTS